MKRYKQFRLIGMTLLGLLGFTMTIPMTISLSVSSQVYEIQAELAGYSVSSDGLTPIDWLTGPKIGALHTQGEMPRDIWYQKQISGVYAGSELEAMNYEYRSGSWSRAVLDAYHASWDDAYVDRGAPNIDIEMSQARLSDESGNTDSPSSERMDYVASDGTSVVLMRSYFTFYVRAYTTGSYAAPVSRVGDNLLIGEGSGGNSEGTYSQFDSASNTVFLSVYVRLSVHSFSYPDLLDEGFQWIKAGVAGVSTVNPWSNLDLVTASEGSVPTDQPQRTANPITGDIERYERLYEAVQSINALPLGDNQIDLQTELPSDSYMVASFILQPGTAVVKNVWGNDERIAAILDVEAGSYYVATVWSLWAKGSERDFLSSDSTVEMMDLTGRSEYSAEEPTLGSFFDMEIFGLTITEWLFVIGVGLLLLTLGPFIIQMLLRILQTVRRTGK